MAKFMQIAGCLLAGLLSLCGCRTVKSPSLDPAQQQARQLELEQTVARQQRQIEQLSAELEALRGFPSERLDTLVHVKQLHLGRFTRLLDTDQNTIPDQVKIYLELRDVQGDTIKAAGSALVELYDLSASQDQQKIAQWQFDPTQLARQWRGGLMADHYLLELNLSSNPPVSSWNLTLRVCFTDALTGQTLEVQKLLTRENPTDREKKE